MLELQSLIVTGVKRFEIHFNGLRRHRIGQGLAHGRSADGTGDCRPKSEHYGIGGSDVAELLGDLSGRNTQDRNILPRFRGKLDLAKAAG